jgi:DNA-binding transcriptional LysR family regulator
MSGTVRSADIAELRAFCAAVDLGSLGRAARLLRVSQPALSKRIRVLEALAGAQLLERSSRGVTPTPAGARLYAEARKLLAQAETVDALLAGLSADDAPVRLAASHTIAEYVLPAPLVEFEQRRERHLSVELIIANSLVVRDLVREGRAEFGIAATARDAPPDTMLRELPFCDDEVVVAVPERHAWARRRTIPLTELTRIPMIMRDPAANTRRVVEAALEARGLALQPPLAEVGSTSAAKATALRENAPVLTAGLAVPGDGEGLVVRRVSGVDFRRRFVILLGAPEVVSAGALALVQYLLDDQGVAVDITAG